MQHSFLHADIVLHLQLGEQDPRACILKSLTGVTILLSGLCQTVKKTHDCDRAYLLPTAMLEGFSDHWYVGGEKLAEPAVPLGPHCRNVGVVCHAT